MGKGAQEKNHPEQEEVLNPPRGEEDPQDTVVALHLGMPVDPVPTGSERTRRCLGKVCTTSRQRILAGAVIVVLTCVIVGLSAAMQGQKTAPVLVCPYEWVGYRNTCYYLSGWHEQGSWDWSQEQCSRHGASLAMVTRDWELGGAECVYLNDNEVLTSSCWQSRPYICSKPLAVGAAPEKGGG